MIEVMLGWIRTNLDIIFASMACAVVYYLISEEAPISKRISSTLAGFLMAVVFAPPLSQWLNVIEYDYAIGAILALSGRWAVDMALAIFKKFTKEKFGV